MRQSRESEEFAYSKSGNAPPLRVSEKPPRLRSHFAFRSPRQGERSEAADHASDMKVTPHFSTHCPSRDMEVSVRPTVCACVCVCVNSGFFVLTRRDTTSVMSSTNAWRTVLFKGRGKEGTLGDCRTALLPVGAQVHPS